MSQEPQSQPSNPYAQGAAPTKVKSVALPWTLVGVLALVAALLGGMFFAQSQELNRLRGQAPTTTAPKTPAAGGMEQKYPQITEAEGIKLVDALPRRQADDPLALGKADAPVVLTVWSDYRCPFCSKWHRETLGDLQPYVASGSLRIEHRDMVLFGEDSTRAAVAARAAGLQGKYWAFASEVAKAAPLSGHPPIGEAEVIAFAEKAGVPDIKKFKADLASPKLAQAVQADTLHGQSIGIQGTPFFIINRTPVNGAVPSADFEWIIQSYGGKK